MIIDACMFNGEFDLLEIRLNILDSFVDKFILCEADQTFQGTPKALTFTTNAKRFDKWKDRIVYHAITDFPNDTQLLNIAKNSPNVGAGEHFWVREFYQKESMRKAFGGCKDDDIVFISDLDEIFNVDVVKDIKVEHGQVYRPIQKSYFYYINNRSDQHYNGWVGTRFGTFKTLKQYGINHFRTEREVKGILIENGGWHFTLLGFTPEEIKIHTLQTGHVEYCRPDVLNNIETNLTNCQDFVGRGLKMWKDDSNLPSYIINNREQWKHLFRN
jgi:beta-1,4-mannosyl-glycoprotein beta-1,4-N-acetylglucosaminyltransferase